MMQRLLLVRLLDIIFVKSWWVIFCFLITIFLYKKSSQELQLEFSNLNGKCFVLKKKIYQEQHHQNELKLHLENWDDPAVIESALIKKLGLIPKGYVKINIPQKRSISSTDFS